jgi:hypothetical protein
MLGDPSSKTLPTRTSLLSVAGLCCELSALPRPSSIFLKRSKKEIYNFCQGIQEEHLLAQSRATVLFLPCLQIQLWCLQASKTSRKPEK